MRPAAWWRFEAGRPQHLTPSPSHREGTIEERRLAWDDYEIEPLVFLAENGQLTVVEADAIRERALEVAGRIGTGHEHWGSGGVDYPDRRAVKLAVAVDKALGRESEDYAGVDVDTFPGGWTR